jgi:hypothetical protein
MNKQDELRRITGWLTDLGDYTAGNTPGAEMKKRVASMATMLLGDFPIAVYDHATLKTIARECKFWPSYAELCDLLRDQTRQRVELFDAPRLGFDRQSEADKQADVEANIATSWASMSLGDVKTQIRQLDGHPMRNVLGRILGRAVTKHAPQHASLLPVEFLPPGDNDNVVPFPGAPA